MTKTRNAAVTISTPGLYEFAWKPEFREKKRVPAVLKTVDGQLLVGNLHIRNCHISLIDELNSDMEPFIALTEVQDGKGKIAPYTFLVNFSKIVYVSIQSDALEVQIAMLDKHNNFSVHRRKVEVALRLEDGKNLTGMIHVRNSIRRTKDELNARDGKFILLTDIKNNQGHIEPDIYCVNKEHLIFLAVKNDRVHQTPEDMVRSL